MIIPEWFFDERKYFQLGCHTLLPMINLVRQL